MKASCYLLLELETQITLLNFICACVYYCMYNILPEHYKYTQKEKKQEQADSSIIFMLE